jgi:hypothetical protein
MTRTIRLAVGTAAVLAMMSQSAQAQHPTNVRGGTGVTSPSTLVRKGTYMPVSPANNVAAARGGHPVELQTPALAVAAKTSTSPSGFDWAAAGIGAGSVLAVALIGAGAVAAFGRRRTPLSA